VVFENFLGEKITILKQRPIYYYNLPKTRSGGGKEGSFS